MWWRGAGVDVDSPSVLSHHNNSLPSHLESARVRMINHMFTHRKFTLLTSPGGPLCELGYPTPLWGGWIRRWIKGAQWLLSPCTGWSLHVSSLWEFRAGWWAQRRLWGKEGISGNLNSQFHGGVREICTGFHANDPPRRCAKRCQGQVRVDEGCTQGVRQWVASPAGSG